MKRTQVALLLSSALLILSLAACAPAKPGSNAAGSSQAAPKDQVTIKVGATTIPHAEILNFIKPTLAKEGINLEVKEFSDYTQLNPALVSKELDANYFQHIPYLESFNKGTGNNLVAIARVHIEPMGIYSKKLKDLSSVPQGATVAIPNDATNGGRALLLLQSAGLIKLKDGAGITATPLDIADNPKGLKIRELDAASLPRTLDDVDLAVINTNYALEAKLVPTKDALFIEDKNSPYVNVLVVRPEDEDKEPLKKLAAALNTPEVKKFIEEKYQGAVVPAF
ncbi:MAG: D-methionine transport system substrate-binding protein [Bacillota bacterium]|nr:D-methionine transport system substrate-binding protein [Bacillota bacterium]MDK2855692.1 D-methionine transport system substrate-binding protein [Bacillota bacterium]MDK2924916.1 D-methionine transport system substrate-binding protein [Bacillota bacterium]